MYPTISHLIYDIFGVQIPLPIQTFGFFVALAFIAANWIVSIELKRKEKEGVISSTIIKELTGEGITKKDILSSLISGFLIGFKGIYAVLHYSELVADPQGVILSAKGSIIGGLLISLVAVYLKWKEKNKEKLKIPKLIEKEIHPFQLAGNMTIIAAVSGIIGAKIFHNLENIDDFLADPIAQLVSFSGLTFYGGLIAGAIAVIWYGKRYNIKPSHLADSAAPGLMLAYGIGRIGCQMSGDGDWGIKNLSQKPEWMSFLPDWMWSYNFPHNVIMDTGSHQRTVIDGCKNTFWDPYCYQLIDPVWPTAFYEVVMSITIFTILWAIRKHIKVAGALFFIYLIFNGVERFCIEKIRVNTKYNILGGITQAEIISFLLVVIGIIGCFLLYKRDGKTTQ